MNRANIKAVLKDYEGALEDFNIVIRLNPADATALTIRGCFKAIRADFEGALADYHKALQLEPTKADFLFRTQKR